MSVTLFLEASQLIYICVLISHLSNNFCEYNIIITGRPNSVRYPLVVLPIDFPNICYFGWLFKLHSHLSLNEYSLILAASSQTWLYCQTNVQLTLKMDMSSCTRVVIIPSRGYILVFVDMTGILVHCRTVQSICNRTVTSNWNLLLPK